MRKLVVYRNEHFEEEKALFDLDSNKLLLKGDYYHCKIDFLIAGYLLALNIKSEDVEEIGLDSNHPLFERIGFYEGD